MYNSWEERKDVSRNAVELEDDDDDDKRAAATAVLDEELGEKPFGTQEHESDSR